MTVPKFMEMKTLKGYRTFFRLRNSTFQEIFLAALVNIDFLSQVSEGTTNI